MSMALGTMRSSSRACSRLEQQNHQPKAVAQHGGKQQASRLPSTKLAAAATDVQQSESFSFPGLTTQQVQQFHEDGFLALPGFASHEQVRDLWYLSASNPYGKAALNFDLTGDLVDCVDVMHAQLLHCTATACFTGLHNMYGAPPARARACNRYVYIPELVQVSAMIARANELVAGWDPELENKRFSVFTTKEEQTHAKVSHSH
jgi:hypothetical protein